MSEIDLRPFLRAMGGAPTRGALDVPEREEPDTPAELLDTSPAKITAAPIAKAVFVDGIQSNSVLTYRMHRPVTLVAAAAGGVDSQMNPRRVIENYEVLCAREDFDWVMEKDCPLSVRVVSESVDPTMVERATSADLKNARDGLEILLTADLLAEAAQDEWVLVDGHLANRPADAQLGGIIKSTDTRLLSDESVLWGLPEGWRSPRFVMPANHGGPSEQRYSCYVRMRPAGDKPWGFGLIRVEAYDPDQLDTIAATALAFRQPSGTHDSRGDRHVAPVALVEKWLRSRRPGYL